MLRPKNIYYIIPFILYYFACYNGINAQLSIHSIGIDFGTIQNVDPHSDFIDGNPILFPELYLGGNFIEPHFNWKVSLGYWNEGESEPKYTDAINFSYSSFVINTKIVYLFPDSNPNHSSPFRILAGFSYHYISAEDIERYESETVPKNDFTDHLFYFNTGLELHLFIKSNVSLFAKGIIFLQLNKDGEYNYSSPRIQLSLGLNYQFSH